MLQRFRTLVSIILLGFSGMPVAAQESDGAAAFTAAANGFTGCLIATVKMGMTTKMDPAKFKEDFAASCKSEEARFRVEAIKLAMANGRTQAAAVSEVDGNIANGRRIFAADHETYVTTGKVPR